MLCALLQVSPALAINISLLSALSMTKPSLSRHTEKKLLSPCGNRGDGEKMHRKSWALAGRALFMSR